MRLPEDNIQSVVKISTTQLFYYAISNVKLGNGSYGSVQLAHNIQSNEPLAAKIQAYSGIEQLEDLQHEQKQLATINDYRGSLNDTKHKIFYLFSEFAAGDSIEKLYQDNTRQYYPDEILNIILSSLYALKSIHDKNVVHNDVHEGNVVYNASSNTSKWVDLAFSITLEPHTKSTKISLPTDKNPPSYKAPESNIERGFATDIYQLGFMSLRMLLIFSEPDLELKKRYIDSREESFKAIQVKYKTIPQEANLIPFANIIALLFRMIEPEKDKRPTLLESINEFEDRFMKIKNINH